MPDSLGAGIGAGSLALRPERPQDDAFLLSLYASTRQAELELTGWDQSTRDGFVLMQFTAQRQYYRSLYPNARYDVIEHAGTSVGRLYVRVDADEITLMDIALVPEYRCRGIGSALLQALVDESTRCAKPLVLHVEVNNPRAHAWYARFGFEDAQNDAMHILMRRAPGPG